MKYTYAPALRVVSGTTPGQLDPNQPSRVLHDSTGRLSFATYSPLVARNDTAPSHFPDLNHLSLHEELCKNKRIVLETTATGDIFWRWVPRAHLEEGVDDEGNWPREVLYCGMRLVFSQDQWDIHKLDPEFDCIVPPPPAPPVIKQKDYMLPPMASTVKQPQMAFPPSSNHLPARPQTPPPNPTHRNTPPLTPSKRPKPGSASSSSTESLKTPPSKKRRADNGADETSIQEGMKVDGQTPHNNNVHPIFGAVKITPGYSPMPTSEMDQDTNFGDISDSSDEEEEEERSRPAKSRKRKMSPYDDRRAQRQIPVRPARMHHTDSFPKRARTASPKVIKRELHKLAEETARKREERVRKVKEHRANFMHQQFMDSIIMEENEEEFEGLLPESKPEEPAQQYESPNGTTPEPPDEVDEEELSREAMIEESRRKLQQLESDKPLWEEQARRRREQEEVEERDRQSKRRAREEAAAAEQREKSAAEEQRRKAARTEEADAAKHEANRQEYIQRQREQQRRTSRGAFTRWTSQDALDYYTQISEKFDKAKFGTNGAPPTFDTIPWPIKKKPALRTLEDIDWESVEDFFRAAEYLLPREEYKTVVAKSHRRFHPDRWRSRGVLLAVENEVEKDCLEVAANTVAQALTPIWRDTNEVPEPGLF